MLESFGQLATISIVVIVGIVVLMFAASATSIGRAMLPDAVLDAAAKLIPQGIVLDGEANAYGEFQLQVKGATKLKTVHVRRTEEYTVAWTFDPTLKCPPIGTYALVDFRHNLDADSDSALAPERVQARIDAALADTLPAKQFSAVDAASADILVSAFAAIDDAVAVDDLMDGFQYQHNDEWKSAIRTAQKYGGANNPKTVASGSIMLYLLDASSRQLLWRAAAIGKIVVDVSDAERERRIRLAVAEMLKNFPPA